MLYKVAETKQHSLNPSPSINDFLYVFSTLLEVYNKRLEGGKTNRAAIEWMPRFSDYVFGETGLSEADRKTLPDRIVSYAIVSRENGTLNAKEVGGTRDVAMKLREERDIKVDGEDKIVEIYGKTYNNTVRLDCWSPSAAQAEKLVYDVEGMLEVHLQFLKSLGFKEVRYKGRALNIQYDTKTDYHVRSFNIFVLTDRLWYIYREKIKEIEIYVKDKFASHLENKPK